MTLKQADALARKNLSPKRYLHTKNVAKEARVLALRFGADEHKAQLAAWLHDVVKEYSREELLQLAGQDDIIKKSIINRPQPIWHGPCGAVYARQMGVNDQDVLNAIVCHTTGSENMSLLDKVVFLADAICEERDFEGVEHIRTLAQADLDAAVAATMWENIAHLRRKGKPLDEQTLAALNALDGACDISAQISQDMGEKV